MNSNKTITTSKHYIKYIRIVDNTGYENYLLCQAIDESVDGNNKRVTFTPDKRNIVFNKQDEIVLLCDDTEWVRIMKSYGSIENCLEARI